MLWIHTGIIQGSRDQFAFDQSPGLIAVFHALHRLLAPRHPPHALSSLAALIYPLPICLGIRTKIDQAPLPLSVHYRTGLCNESLTLAILRRIQRSITSKQETSSKPIVPGEQARRLNEFGVVSCEDTTLFPLPNCQRTKSLQKSDGTIILGGCAKPATLPRKKIEIPAFLPAIAR